MSVAPAQSASAADRVIDWLRDYAGSRINSFLIDERRCIPPYIVLDFGNAGLLGLQAPFSCGGMGLGNRDAMRVMEQLGGIDLTLAMLVGVHNGLGIRPLHKFGSPALKDDALGALATGRELGAFALTEPSAGSNPLALQASGTPDGPSAWRLTGTKWWSGNAAWAGWINVFVRTPTGGKRSAVTAFAVRQGTPGLRQGDESLTMGVRGMVQNTIRLEAVKVTDRNLLGEVGGGMTVAHDALMHARLGLAAISIGAMKRCGQLMRGYSRQRVVGSGRLIDNAVTRERLAELVSATEVLEALVGHITDRLDAGREVSPDLYAVCKTSAPELLWQSVDHCMQCFGGRGYIETTGVAQMFRDARLLRIFEGPTETLNAFLGTRLLTGHGDVPGILEDCGANEVAVQLREVVEEVTVRAVGTASWAAIVREVAGAVGELTTDAVLAAVGLRSNSDAATWTSRRFADGRCRFTRRLRQTSRDFGSVDRAIGNWPSLNGATDSGA